MPHSLLTLKTHIYNDMLTRDRLTKNKKNNYDLISDLFYIIIEEGYEEKHEEEAPGINVELDKNDKPIGIEILNASKNIVNFLALRYN